MDALWKFIKGRLKEKSTWAAGASVIAWAVGMFGFELDAEAQVTLTTVIGGILAVVAGATKTKNAED